MLFRSSAISTVHFHQPSDCRSPSPFVVHALTRMWTDPNIGSRKRKSARRHGNGIADPCERQTVLPEALEDMNMIITIVGVIVAAVAIKVDQMTRYQYKGFPLVALGGVLTVILSLVF